MTETGLLQYKYNKRKKKKKKKHFSWKPFLSVSKFHTP